MGTHLPEIRVWGTGEWQEVLVRPHLSEEVHRKSGKASGGSFAGGNVSAPALEPSLQSLAPGPSLRSFSVSVPSISVHRDTPATLDHKTTAQSLLQQLLPKKQVSPVPPD